jgi:hypothetical protein
VSFEPINSNKTSLEPINRRFEFIRKMSFEPINSNKVVFEPKKVSLEVVCSQKLILNEFVNDLKF